MATASEIAKRGRETKEFTYLWVGKNKAGKVVRGEQRAASEAVVNATLRRQGILVTKVTKQKFRGGRKVSEKDIALFTRQLATMMKSGVPLLQTFDIVGRGHDNPSVGKLLLDIKSDVETGSSLSQAFRKFPLHFDALYCNLVAAGEQAGILETLLDRLATYKEKMLAIKSKIKSALFYPIAVIIVAFIITAVIMIFVIPAFKEVFTNFGADLPSMTLMVIAISDFFVAYWWAIFGGIAGAFIGGRSMFKKSLKLQHMFQRYLLKAPVFGDLVYKGALARWSRTLATMFAAGVPLVEALESVGGATGNIVFEQATNEIRNKVSVGTTLTQALVEATVFPNMLIQMTQIGEEAGALDSMLNKVADFYEAEVDDAVAALASLMEPMIMAFLGVIIGGLVVALYLPIFKMGSVAG